MTKSVLPVELDCCFSSQHTYTKQEKKKKQNCVRIFCFNYLYTFFHNQYSYIHIHIYKLERKLKLKVNILNKYFIRNLDAYFINGNMKEEIEMFFLIMRLTELLGNILYPYV